jgi:hypothetical protein
MSTTIYTTPTVHDPAVLFGLAGQPIPPSAADLATLRADAERALVMAVDAAVLCREGVISKATFATAESEAVYADAMFAVVAALVQ